MIKIFTLIIILFPNLFSTLVLRTELVKTNVSVIKGEEISELEANNMVLNSEYYTLWINDMKSNRENNFPNIYPVGLIEFGGKVYYEFELRENTGVLNAMHERVILDIETGKLTPFNQ